MRLMKVRTNSRAQSLADERDGACDRIVAISPTTSAQNLCRIGPGSVEGRLRKQADDLRLPDQTIALSTLSTSPASGFS